MSAMKFHTCQCRHCRQKEFHPNKKLHYEMNLFLSRLNKGKRLQYVTMESKRMGGEGDRLLSQITGIDVKTIRRERQKL